GDLSNKLRLTCTGGGRGAARIAHRFPIPRTLKKKLEKMVCTPSPRNTTPGITNRSDRLGSRWPNPVSFQCHTAKTDKARPIRTLRNATASPVSSVTELKILSKRAFLFIKPAETA